MSIIGELFGIPNDNWVDDATCVQVDTGDLFFPEPGTSASDARRICLGCPVRSECLRHAMDTDETWGVWGAFTQRDRHRLNRGENPLRPRSFGTGKRANGHSIACKCFGCKGVAA